MTSLSSRGNWGTLHHYHSDARYIPLYLFDQASDSSVLLGYNFKAEPAQIEFMITQILCMSSWSTGWRVRSSRIRCKNIFISTLAKARRAEVSVWLSTMLGREVLLGEPQKSPRLFG